MESRASFGSRSLARPRGTIGPSFFSSPSTDRRRTWTAGSNVTQQPSQGQAGATGGLQSPQYLGKGRRKGSRNPPCHLFFRFILLFVGPVPFDLSTLLCFRGATGRPQLAASRFVRVRWKKSTRAPRRIDGREIMRFRRALMTEIRAFVANHQLEKIWSKFYEVIASAGCSIQIDNVSSHDRTHPAVSE